MKLMMDIKKSLFAAFIGSLSMTAAAVCQYPYNATQATLNEWYALGGDLAYPYINLQSTEFPVVYGSIRSPGQSTGDGWSAWSEAGLRAYINAQTGAAPAVGDIILPASGIVAFEVNVDKFPALSSSNANVSTAVGLIGAGEENGAPKPFQAAILFHAARDNRPAGFGVEFFTDNDQEAQSLTLPMPLPANYRFGVYLNMTTRQIGFTAGGVDYGYFKKPDGTPYLMPTGTLGGLITQLSVNRVLSPTDPIIGQTMGSTLVTDRAQFTQPFPAGTTDICGTPASNPDDDGRGKCNEKSKGKAVGNAGGKCRGHDKDGRSQPRGKLTWVKGSSDDFRGFRFPVKGDGPFGKFITPKK